MNYANRLHYVPLLLIEVPSHGVSTLGLVLVQV